MKITILFVIVACVLPDVSLAKGDNEQLDEDEQACISETDVSKDIVIEAKDTYTVFADDPKYKEFLSCCWKRYGMQRENGEIDWEKIQEILKNTYKPPIPNMLAERCKNNYGVTDGDTVVLVLECLDTHAPTHHTIHGYYGGRRN